MIRNINVTPAGVLRSIVLLLALGAAQLGLAAPNPSFNIIGHIENFTLASSADPLSQATLTVRGIPITIPSSLLIVMPGQYLTAHDIFRFNLTTHAYDAVARTDNSGLALRDTPPPAIPYEAEVIGNIVGGQYIAGVVHISQGALHTTTGTILDIDEATGFFSVGPLGGGAAVRVRLNDPEGIYGPPSTDLDSRFALDPENSPVHAKTGFPVCLRRNDAPAKCPPSNRPAGANAFRFTCAGIGGNGQPAGVGVVPAVPAVSCDPRLPVPLAVGDTVTVVGMLAKDAANNFFIAAHGLDAEIGIYTSPGVDPAYVFIEEGLQGAKGEPFDVPQEQTTRFRIVGFTTDPTRNVEVSQVDSGFDDAVTILSGLSGLTPSNGPQLGRFRNTWPSKDDARAVRRDVRARIVDVTTPVPLPNGLTPGFYTAPIGEYIYPEATQFGVVAAGTQTAFQLPVPFENFCFLKRGGAMVTTVDPVQLGAISPFPDSGHPLSQQAGNPPSRVCND